MDDFEERILAKLDVMQKKLDENGLKDDEIASEIDAIRHDLRLLRQISTGAISK